MDRKALIKKVEQEFGLTVVELRYFPQYRNVETKCWDIEISFEGQVYDLIEADTLPELLAEIEYQLM